MSTEEKELEVTSTEAPKKPARKPRKPVDPAVWEELKAMQESGEVLTVKINAAVNAGVISYVKGVRGFIPASLLSIAYVEDLNEWVDKSIEVKVITVDPEEKRLVLSGKAVEQEKAAAERAAKMDAVNVGDIYDGKVERITSFGAFVGFADDLSGLVHISQMANKHIESPNEVVKVGDEVKADLFEAGDIVDVTGTSKGHGFQGNIKRWGQSRGPMAHGSRYHRRPGSMGVIINRVMKGKMLPGRMGGKRVTIQNLDIVKADMENGVLLIKGNVPGANKSYVTIKSTVK